MVDRKTFDLTTMNLNSLDGADKDPEVSFEPLSTATLDEVVACAKKVFPWDRQEIERHYRYSLEPDKYKAELAAENIESLSYWSVTRGKKIIGLTGLYREIDDPEGRVSIGWFGIDPDERSGGMGRAAVATLLWTVQKAREEGYTKLHFWGTDVPGEGASQTIYDRLGFFVTGTEAKPDKGYVVTHREKDLLKPDRL